MSVTPATYMSLHTLIINNMVASIAGISIPGFGQITYARFMCRQDAHAAQQLGFYFSHVSMCYMRWIGLAAL